jgi:hypothetical protein
VNSATSMAALRTATEYRGWIRGYFDWALRTARHADGEYTANGDIPSYLPDLFLPCGLAPHKSLSHPQTEHHVNLSSAEDCAVVSGSRPASDMRTYEQAPIRSLVTGRRIPVTVRQRGMPRWSSVRVVTLCRVPRCLVGLVPIFPSNLALAD